MQDDKGGVAVNVGLEAEPFEESGALVAPQEDGSSIIALDGPPKPKDGSSDFTANLAESMEPAELSRLGSELVHIVRDDDSARKQWKKTYKRGLNLLGLIYEDKTEPWEGACGAFHPLLLESVIRFNAQAMTDIFPAAGPIKTEIVGAKTKEKEAQAHRVFTDLNYLAKEKIKGYREETDMMLFNLSMAGTTFRKFGFDEKRKVPWAEYVLPEHVIMPYAAAGLYSTDRFAIELNKHRNWVDARIESGEFLPMGLNEQSVSTDDIQQARDKIEGKADTSTSTDVMYKLYELHIDYLFEHDPMNESSLPLPYLIMLDANSNKVLSIRRNWKDGDEAQERMVSLVQHKYMPGFGPYGTGLISILGGLTDSATSILRQLVDAGTLSNLPGGFKTKEARIIGDEDPVGPGEFRDVDIGMGTLRDSFFSLPYGEPSSVLVALLGQVVDEGRRIGSVADMKITDMTGQNMPVGTTMAIIERSMKVMSAVQRRLYESFKNEYKVIAEIVRDFMGEIPYPFELNDREKKSTRKQDYDDRLDIIPVADPDASTMAQKIMVLQAVIQLTQAAPTIYNLKNVHRDMIEVLGSDKADYYIPPDEDIQPRDPVTENMDLLNGKPVKAGIAQDHDAHIKVHVAASEDPKIKKMLENNPLAPAIISSSLAHVNEHLGFKYRKDLEELLGVPLPPPNEPLPEDVEYELSRLVASAADKLLEKNKAEEQQADILDAMEDPVIQNERKALDIKQQQVDNKKVADDKKLSLEDRSQRLEALLRIFREMSETERSTLAVGMQMKTSATKEQLSAAEKASDLGDTQMSEIAKLFTGMVAGDKKG